MRSPWNILGGMWTVTARFTVFGHTFKEADLTPVLGLALLALVIAALILGPSP